MFTATCLGTLALCALTMAAPAPHRSVTYNQTQHGVHNVQADLENILILVVPSRKFIGSALNLFDRRDIPAQKNLPEPPEIATEIIKEQEIVGSVKPVKPAAVKEQNLPEPPEPAKVEDKPQSVATKVEVKPATPQVSKDQSAAATVVQDKKQVKQDQQNHR